MGRKTAQRAWKIANINNPDTVNIFNYLVKLKKLSLKTVFIFLAVLLALAAGIYQLHLRFQYERFMASADANKAADNYVEAAKDYEQASVSASKIPLNKNNYVEALCKEGNSFLVSAMKKTMSGDEDAADWYAKAAGIYGNIINDKNFESCDYYVDALCGLSTVYEYTGHFCDEEWKELTNSINNKAIELKMPTSDSIDPSSIDDELLKRYIKITSSYCGYINSAIQQEQAFTAIPILMQSAIGCWKQWEVFVKIAAERDLELSVIIDPTYNAVRQAELLTLFASSGSADSPEYAEEAVAICQTALEDVNLRNSEISTYIALNTIMGEAYRALGNYYKEDESRADMYMKAAHDLLIPMLKLRGENVTLEQTVSVAYQAIFTGKCSEQELNEILRIYQEFYNQLNFANDPRNATTRAMNICDACRGIIDIYGFSQDAWEMGQNTVQKISLIENYVQYSHRGGLQEFKEYFDQAPE